MTDRELMQQAQPEQEFTTHEEGKDGWSDWVCPDPQSYLMKCCDCGLVHEAQFGVVRYKSETEREDCDIVDDPNLQAVFRMRRSEQWTPKDTAYRPGGLAQPEQCQYPDCKCATENPCLKGLAQPEQEPVFDCPRCGHCCPQRKPLTEEEIAAGRRAPWGRGLSLDAFKAGVRFAETTHGIKEKNT